MLRLNSSVITVTPSSYSFIDQDPEIIKELREKVIELIESSKRSPLEEINIMRLMKNVKKSINDFLNSFAFEPNDQITRDAVEHCVKDWLKSLPIIDYVVVCDETNNSPERVEQNELHVDIAIKPSKDDNFIYLSANSKIEKYDL